MTTVGILGGGQLGRMLALAAAPLGLDLLVVEPSDRPPVTGLAEVLRAPYGDAAALAELARRCDVVTVELEGVPVGALAWLAERVPVRPGPRSIGVTQDRLVEKEALAAAGIATAPWAPGRVAFAGGTLVKARRGGYDGRGQVLVAEDAGPEASFDATLDLGDDVISEGVVPFDRELSIVAARSLDGEVACFPVVENRHAEGILRRTSAPAQGWTTALQEQAAAIGSKVAEALDHVGVLAVELFQVDDRLVANEVAPRVHNSGHWTIDGAETSQFEQHLRAICGWPLGPAQARGPSVMLNLIGGVPDPACVLAVPGAHLHLYAKAPRPGRKVGHITVVAEDEDELAERVSLVEPLVAASTA